MLVGAYESKDLIDNNSELMRVCYGINHSPQYLSQYSVPHHDDHSNSNPNPNLCPSALNSFVSTSAQAINVKNVFTLCFNEPEHTASELHLTLIVVF